MKVAICSDLHLEFDMVELKNPGEVDVLILSGDICVATDLDYVDDTFMRKSVRLHEFFQNCSKEFKNVIYVAGNHEHYHGDFANTLSLLKKRLAYLENLHVLDKETIFIDDHTFVGSTMWTSMNKEDPNTMFHVGQCMNDFRIIKNSDRYVYRNVPVYEYNEDGSLKKDEDAKPMQIGMKKKQEVSKFSTQDAVDENKKAFDYLKHVCENVDGPIVVVSHHTPTHMSCHPRYVGDRLMNGGYHNDYSEFILDNPKIKLWTHGHTHDHFDYMVGSTRVVCNPRGYANYETIADNFKLKVVEI